MALLIDRVVTQFISGTTICLVRKTFGYPSQRHDCEIFYSAEIEKYRNLYNDVRSKFTILCGDYEHLKLEHKDEMGKSIVKFLCKYR